MVSKKRVKPDIDQPPKDRRIMRDATTGQFVSSTYAKRNPGNTIISAMKPASKRRR